MPERALVLLESERNSLLLIENDGNLVCPALFDLGERAKVVRVSVTPGAAMPLKYPRMFSAATVAILSKIDLLPHLRFDAERAIADALAVNPRFVVLPLSTYSGEGLPRWYQWLTSELAAAAAADGGWRSRAVGRDGRAECGGEAPRFHVGRVVAARRVLRGDRAAAGRWVGLLLYYSARYPSLVGLGFAAYMFGLRHAFDADHIAAVDDTVRFLMKRGQRPLVRDSWQMYPLGLLFGLGFDTASEIGLLAPPREPPRPRCRVPPCCRRQCWSPPACPPWTRPTAC